MTLRRTVSALASMHVFYKADVVVFCEGGQSRTHTEAMRYLNDDRTLDGVFWSSVVSLFVRDKRLHFKSVGSKSTLVEISNDVQASGVETVTVCFDSDYDRLLGKQLSNARVAYTLTYSWESDVLHDSVIEEILTTLVGPLSQDTIFFVRETTRKIESDLVRWCEVDITLKHKNKICIFDRKNPLATIDINTFPPYVAHERLNRRLREQCGYKIKPKRVVAIGCNNVRSVIFGKLLSKAYYHLIVAIAKRSVSDIKIDYDTVMRLAIRFTARELSSGNLADMHRYYAGQAASF